MGEDGESGRRSRKISPISEETKLLNKCKTMAGVQQRGEGEWRDVPPLSLSPRLRRFQAHLREAGASVLKAQEPGPPQAVASGHWSASSGSTVGSS